MKKVLFVALIVVALFSCTKQRQETKRQESTIYQVQLQIVDIDGKIQYSDIKTVTF
jgi:hypothetical protein